MPRRIAIFEEKMRNDVQLHLLFSLVRLQPLYMCLAVTPSEVLEPGCGMAILIGLRVQ